MAGLAVGVDPVVDPAHGAAVAAGEDVLGVEAGVGWGGEEFVSEGGAHAIEGGDLALREREFGRWQEVGELLRGVGADNGRDNSGSRHLPGKGYGGRCHVVSSGDTVERFEYGEAGGVHVLTHAAGAGAPRLGLTRTVLAGEEAGGERTVPDHSDALALAERGEFILVLRAVDEVVVRLERFEVGQAVLAGDAKGFRELRGREVRGADVADLA